MIVLEGVPEFNRALESLVARMSAASRKAATTGGHLIEAGAKKNLGLRAHARGTPTPSPPGSPPALITGTLRRSIRVTAAEPVSITGWTVSVGPTVVYGRIQELGGDAGRGGSVHLPPRPYLEPALQEVVDSGALWGCYAAAWREAF